MWERGKDFTDETFTKVMFCFHAECQSMECYTKEVGVNWPTNLQITKRSNTGMYGGVRMGVIFSGYVDVLMWKHPLEEA